MLNTIKKILSFHTKNTTAENINQNEEIVLKEFPIFDFSTFSNHTMIDVVISPVNENNNSIKLYIPESIFKFIDLQMEDDFKIQFKPEHNGVYIGNGKNPRIEIPSHHLKSVSNHSMGSLHVKKGIDIKKKVTNSGSGDIFIEQFLGQVIENKSMGEINIENIDTHSLSLISGGSGSLSINNGQINNLDSQTKSMGNVHINANISYAKIYSSGSGETKVSKISNDTDIQLKSMGNIIVDAPSIEQLIVSSSGSGKVTIKNLNTKLAEFTLKSMGKIDVRGESIQADIKSSGSGIFKGNFLSKNAVLALSSMGDVHLEVTHNLKASIKGMGSINLLGEHILDNLEAEITSMGRIKSDYVKTQSLAVIGKSNQCSVQTLKSQNKPRF